MVLKMIYDAKFFDEVFERRGHDATKWDYPLFVKDNKDIVPMWVADMDFRTPDCIVDAMAKRLEHHAFGYFKIPQAYFDGIAKWQKERYGVDGVTADQVDYQNGVLGGVSSFVEAYSLPGDWILLNDTCYTGFQSTIANRGRNIVYSPVKETADGWALDIEDMEKKIIEKKPPIMIFCNPHNPVGRVWTEDEVRNIVELCKKYSVWLFSDEIHGDVVLYGHQYTSAARFADVYDHMLVYTAISKTFNMAGLHSSCTIIPNPEYKKIQEDTLRQAWLMSPNCMANSAIEACYTYGDEWVDEQNAYLTENAEFVTSYLKEHAPQIKPVKPEGTYLMWLDCSELSMTSEEIVKILASEYKMAVGGGAGYQGNGEYFLRFNIGCPRETLEKGMEILAQFVADKKGV